MFGRCPPVGRSGWSSSAVPTKLHKGFREMAVAVCRDGSRAITGKAASIVASVGFVNFLGDPSQPMHMTTDEMAERIGVSPATLHAKAKVVRDSLDIRRMDPLFSTKDVTDQ